MTEHEWLASSDPQAMLKYLQTGLLETHERPGGVRVTAYHAPLPIATDRKLRLFACACCRSIWGQLADDHSRAAVMIAEEFADGLATTPRLKDARGFAWDALCTAGWDTFRNIPWSVAWESAWESACDIAWNATRHIPPTVQANLLRDIFGNPWEPLAWPSDVKGFDNHWRVNYSTQLIETEYLRDRCIQIQPHWLTPTVKALAQAAYEERMNKVCPDCDGEGEIITSHRSDCFKCRGTGQLETGHLDPDRLLILADALEEAGCDNEEILRHLKGQKRGHLRCSRCGSDLVPQPMKSTPTLSRCTNNNCGATHGPFWAQVVEGNWYPLDSPHVRGCWVVDLLLGKE